MRSLRFLLALPCTWLLAGQTVSKVAFTESKSMVRAFSAYGETTIPAIRAQLDIHRPDGKIKRGNLVVIYDPETGHYLWFNSIAHYPGDTSSFYPDLESGAATVYAGLASLVNFNMHSALFVQEHREHADNLDAAELDSINEIERRNREDNLYGSDMKEVPLYQAIGREFACAPLDLSAMCSFMAKGIVSVSRQGENWRLIIRNRWDQEVILDSKFDLVSTQRLFAMKEK